jgi:hypothetical protein
MPEKLVFPFIVTIPAVVVSAAPTATDKLDNIVKLFAVEIVPNIFNAKNVIVPLPANVFDEPLNVLVPLLAAKTPFTVKFPAILIFAAVVMFPDIFKLLNVNPFPKIVLAVPVIDTIPLEA